MLHGAISVHLKKTIFMFIVQLDQIAGVLISVTLQMVRRLKPGKGLHPAVIKYVKGVFDDLSSDELSSKCLHGKTQNQNETFNGTIWTRIPNTNFVDFKVFELSVLDAVAHFNIGNLATLLIFDKLGIRIKYVLTIPNEKAWTVQKVVDVFFVVCEKTRVTKQKSWRGLYMVVENFRTVVSGMTYLTPTSNL